VQQIEALAALKVRDIPQQHTDPPLLELWDQSVLESKARQVANDLKLDKQRQNQERSASLLHPSYHDQPLIKDGVTVKGVILASKQNLLGQSDYLY
jgi:hypothetical protein